MNFDDLREITVLYVEDEDILRDNIADMLQDVCKGVFTASNGEEGYKLFLEKQEYINVIISDIQMPKLSGIEMSRKIKAETLDIPIIITTAFSDAKYLYESINVGIDAYTEKPVDMMHLLQTIQKALLPFAQQKALLKQAYTDKLTDLSNRAALDLALEKNVHTGLMIMDIDEFKVINDLYGTEIGNFVLKEFAQFLTLHKKESWDLYRIGSDEFTFVMHEHANTKYFEQAIQTLLDKLKTYYIYEHSHDIKINLNMTIGISFEEKNVLETADMGLRKAKETKQHYLIYTYEHSYKKVYENDIQWIHRVDIAIKTNNIIPFFQPIVDKNKNIVKYECLMRLREEGKYYSPIFFLETAKKNKTYKNLTMIMLHNIFDIMQRFPQYDFSINLSHIDITDNEIVEYLMTNLIEKDLGTRIIFEILEDEGLEDKEQFNYFVTTAKEIGAKIAIDDFGTGYSNFSYLLELKPDIIKIDGSLIENIHKDENAYAITEAIVNFSKRLNIETITEFVHSKEVYETLKALDVDYFQGYFFGEPVAEDAIK
ncbi:EAL domain-containing protein [Sulfurovum sp.]|uniref:two-component system response regulator n=1 Tax=Sulfurovum sp. TaxID=1969726 RepID=UPI002867C98D|nr:EAL domain-containing protein [Sulfurovum sp.]